MPCVTKLSVLVITPVVCRPQMVAAVSDQFNQLVERVIVIDCRYPYEFEGGHIKVSEDLTAFYSPPLCVDASSVPGLFLC